jgi:hypothetical protein
MVGGGINKTELAPRDHQIKQLGAASNTLFALASAGLRYSLSLLSESSKSLVANNTACIRLFTCAFAVSFLLGFLSIFNRLEDFRRSKERHKRRDESHDAAEVKTIYRTTRRIGAWTWGLLYAQALFFAFGGGTIIYFWIANYGKKL